MEPRLVNPRLLKIWRYLGSSDHLYYMFTFGGAPGEVHSYFSPYDTPYDAFITYLSVLMDFDSHIHKDIVQANEPFTFSLGEGRFLKTVYGIKDFIEAVKDIDINSIKYHTTRGDLEKWAKYSLLDQALADRIKKITEKVLDDTELREEIRKAFEDRLRELNSSL
jgi:alpha-amylase